MVRSSLENLLAIESQNLLISLTEFRKGQSQQEEGGLEFLRVGVNCIVP